MCSRVVEEGRLTRGPPYHVSRGGHSRVPDAGTSREVCCGVPAIAGALTRIVAFCSSQRRTGRSSLPSGPHRAAAYRETDVKILYSIIGLSCFGLLAGCGGDDDGSSTQVDTGIAEDKALSDVTADEMRNACESMRGAMQDVIDADSIVNMVCTLMAASETETEGECNQQRAECVDQFRDLAEEQAEEIDFECDGDVSQFAGCDVTVGVLESCLNDTLAQFRAVLSQYSCEDAGQIDDADLENLGANFDVDPPASCEPLVDQCGGAGVIGGDEDADF
jgi:hypothetical protein